MYCALQVGCQAASCEVYVNTIGKCILSGENTLHWTTEYCFVQSDWQCILTTNLQSTIVSLDKIVLLKCVYSTQYGATRFVCCILHK